MFDLLYFNGESLVKRPFSERRKLLKENFVEVEEQFLLATSLDTTTMEEVQDFLEESIKGKNKIQSNTGICSFLKNINESHYSGF